jgi:hypothetical protein
MQIDFSRGHFSKAYAPIACSFEPDSNRSSEKESQQEKQYLPRTVTVDGMQIDLSHEHFPKA